MIVGVVKEIRNQENRVALTPDGVETLIQHGHAVWVEQQAGLGSGFADHHYTERGAQLCPTAAQVWQSAQLMLKVKEPQIQEYPLLQPEQMLFTYFHFAASQSLTQAVIDAKCVAIAYETVENRAGHLPLLTPMSEVAGRMAIQESAKYLERAQGGRGILLGGVPGVAPATVVVIGAGVVGTEAARMAAGLGAHVKVLDINLERLRAIADMLPANVTTLAATPGTIREALQTADVVVGAVLLKGARAPKLISRALLKQMQPGAVIVDTAIDQGGIFETSRATTHENPVFIEEGIIHYCVTNMPGAVPITATRALTNATLPYVVKLADMGWQAACRDDAGLAMGLNIVQGQVVCQAVAQTFNLPHTPRATQLGVA
ncbi:L-alanine dehydrogenase [Magnetococcus marinus MC-1]|uniref:Alanine dehydrogenase n=1 Tax=Magnetococcus marinus (strain ATCC BAA-1437 / JCM 17883 / MC-1) TaxID=156889 RepID=A0L3P1_MAGMM|nr:alanine dehydrogenase [Magnetococcus marinus]ABK42584.1 L-alanine dehydrogenase [Magnetococcus marinus MC-1]